jgi:hypothetical protein
MSSIELVPVRKIVGEKSALIACRLPLMMKSYVLPVTLLL